MAGGGDGSSLGDVSGGFGGGPTGGDGGASNFGGFGDPSMYPGSMGDTGGLGTYGYPDSGAGSGFGGDTGMAGWNPYSDPTVGAPQSQAPTPGQSPGAIGGTQSDAPQQGQGYGGGSPTQQKQSSTPQVQQMLQQAIKLLQNPQQGGGGPSAASPTLDQLAQGYGGGSSTQQPSMRTAVPPAGQGFGGGDVTQATGEPTPQNILGQQNQDQTQQPSPTDQQRPGDETAQPTAQPSPRPADEAAQQPPPPAATPPVPQGRTGLASTGPRPDLAGPTGPTTAQGGGAGQVNPARFMGDLVQAMFGNSAPLLRDLAAQNQGQPPAQTAAAPSAAPSTAPTAAQAPAAQPGATPTVGSRQVNTQPGAPDGPAPQANDTEGQARKQWYDTHDRTQPFPHDVEAQKGAQAADAASKGQSADGVDGAVLQQVQNVAAMGPGQVSQYMSQNHSPKSGAWCGEFVGAVMNKLGLPTPDNPAWADNWHSWGVKDTKPQVGDVAVKNVHAAHGHVTTVSKVYPDGYVDLTGGNQDRSGKVTTAQHVPPGNWDFRTLRGTQYEQQWLNAQRNAPSPASTPARGGFTPLPPRASAQPNQQVAMNMTPNPNQRDPYGANQQNRPQMGSQGELQNPGATRPNPPMNWPDQDPGGREDDEYGYWSRDKGEVYPQPGAPAYTPQPIRPASPDRDLTKQTALSNMFGIDWA